MIGGDVGGKYGTWNVGAVAVPHGNGCEGDCPRPCRARSCRTPRPGPPIREGTSWVKMFDLRFSGDVYPPFFPDY